MHDAPRACACVFVPPAIHSIWLLSQTNCPDALLLLASWQVTRPSAPFHLVSGGVFSTANVGTCGRAARSARGSKGAGEQGTQNSGREPLYGGQEEKWPRGGRVAPPPCAPARVLCAPAWHRRRVRRGEVRGGGHGEYLRLLAERVEIDLPAFGWRTILVDAPCMILKGAE